MVRPYRGEYRTKAATVPAFFEHWDVSLEEDLICCLMRTVAILGSNGERSMEMRTADYISLIFRLVVSASGDVQNDICGGHIGTGVRLVCMNTEDVVVNTPAIVQLSIR